MVRLKLGQDLTQMNTFFVTVIEADEMMKGTTMTNGGLIRTSTMRTTHGQSIKDQFMLDNLGHEEQKQSKRQ